jgi:hypothetical protein
LGANAIVDGYYREAIANFAASLERFTSMQLASSSRRGRLGGEKSPKRGVRFRGIPSGS